jgi:competence ComEA-like helix-hairpin-helix protein
VTLHDGEIRVLWIVAIVLTVGGGVRWVSHTRPGWTPGIAIPDSVSARTDPVPFGTGAAFDSLFVDGRLVVNRAGPEHLALLPGIGPALAMRVVDYRRLNGPFASADELSNVKGIGPKTVERLRSVVWIESETP